MRVSRDLSNQLKALKMKAKLGKLDAVKGLNYNSYQALVKKTVAEILSDASTNGISDYVLVGGEHLTWGGVAGKADQPLLYLGKKNTWEKDLKASKTMDLKAYSYGTCKVVKIGTDIQISLCPEKGKLTQDSLLKPIKKVFKAFKPKTFFEVVSDLETVESSAGSEANSEASGKELLQTIGVDLQKYHVAIEKVKKVIAAAKSEEEKTPLLVKQNKLLRGLKHLVASWKTDIAPEAASLITDKESETWQKIYQKWNVFFEKRKAAKEGTTTDQDGVKAEEERIYTKALGDLQQFSDNLEKGDLIDPSIIETNVKNLEGHLNKWKTFVEGKKSSFSEELKELEVILKRSRDDWETMKPLLITYDNKNKELNKAIDAFDLDLANSLNVEMEEINNKIKNLF